MTLKKSIITLQTAIILLCGCIGNSQQIDATGNNMYNKLDSLISAEEKQGFHGLVHIELNGKQELYKGNGYANEETKLKFSPSTFVQIGSGVKDFTKVAIYQLVESGKIKLDDLLSKFMPGLTGNKQQITVQHLLVHKAGFSLGEKTDGDPFTTAELIETIQSKPLKFEPGQKENYSNLGYSCLAYIVEQVSGKSFDKYVYDQIMKPIGLVNTGTYIPKFDKANIAHGYGSDGKDIGIILDMPHDENGHLWSLRGNGGYLSTPEEISKFFKAMENNSLLKTDAFRKAVFNPANHIMLAGSDMVSFFLFSNMPVLKARVIIATNHGDYPGPRLLRKIEGLLSGNSNPGNRKVERQIDLGDGNEETKGKYTGPLLEKLPETGAGITIKKYFDAFNSGNPEKIRQFFDDYAKKSESALPIEKRVENYKNFYADMGKLTFVSLNASQSAEGIWEVSVTTSTGDPAKFIFHLDTNSPWKFVGLQIGIGD
jgi:CubicO group peptidase (beta-lactamase class C family)